MFGPFWEETPDVDQEHLCQGGNEEGENQKPLWVGHGLVPGLQPGSCPEGGMQASQKKPQGESLKVFVQERPGQRAQPDPERRVLEKKRKCHVMMVLSLGQGFEEERMLFFSGDGKGDTDTGFGDFGGECADHGLAVHMHGHHHVVSFVRCQFENLCEEGDDKIHGCEVVVVGDDDPGFGFFDFLFCQGVVFEFVHFFKLCLCHHLSGEMCVYCRFWQDVEFKHEKRSLGVCAGSGFGGLCVS